MSASNVRPVALPAASGSVFSSTNGNVTCYGATCRESGGADAVTVNIRDGNSATGNILATYVLALSGVGEPVWFGPQGINAGSGVYVEVVGTGVPLGSVFVG